MLCPPSQTHLPPVCAPNPSPQPLPTVAERPLSGNNAHNARKPSPISARFVSPSRRPWGSNPGAQLGSTSSARERENRKLGQVGGSSSGATSSNARERESQRQGAQLGSTSSNAREKGSLRQWNAARGEGPARMGTGMGQPAEGDSITDHILSSRYGEGEGGAGGGGGKDYMRRSAPGESSPVVTQAHTAHAQQAHGAHTQQTHAAHNTHGAGSSGGGGAGSNSSNMSDRVGPLATPPRAPRPAALQGSSPYGKEGALPPAMNGGWEFALFCRCASE